MTLNLYFVQLSETALCIILYLVPFVLCAIGYIERTWINYQKDRVERDRLSDKPDWKIYRPTDTIGSLLGRAVVTILPIVNLLAALFDVCPEMYGRFFYWVSKLLSYPIVPPKANQ